MQQRYHFKVLSNSNSNSNSKYKNNNCCNITVVVLIIAAAAAATVKKLLKIIKLFKKIIRACFGVNRVGFVKGSIKLTYVLCDGRGILHIIYNV